MIGRDKELSFIINGFTKGGHLRSSVVHGPEGMGKTILLEEIKRAFLSEELKVPVQKIKSFVLGGHGDSMVAMLGSTEVEGKKISELVKEGNLSKERLEQIVDRTKKGGAEIVKFLEKGSAFYAPAASGVEMAECYLKDSKKQLPCAVYLNGEYGTKDIYAGVPAIIGSDGVEKIIELNLSPNEKKNFENSVDAVKELFNAAKKIDPTL